MPQRTAGVVSASGQGQDEFDFDRGTPRQFGRSGRDAGMTACLAKDCDEEIRSSIQYLRLVRKSFRRRDMSDDFHHPSDPYDAPELLLGERQGIQDGDLGCLRSFGDAELAPKLSRIR